MSSSNKGYVKLTNDASSSGTFVHDTFQQQQSILIEQDDTLERVGESLRTIKNMTRQIGDELGEQSEMLDDLGASMLNTDSKMNNVMKKLARLSHLEDDNRQCTAIIVLIGLIVVLLFILVICRNLQPYHFFGVITKDGVYEVDTAGYLLYCPCMGQLFEEQFLGSLNFAQTLNRTLVLPPIVEYPERSTRAKMVDFEDYFQLQPLLGFHRVIPAGLFMQTIALQIWPQDTRKVGCWRPRPGIHEKSLSCHATEGNPFGPFWQSLGVEFVDDFYFGDATGGYDLTNEDTLIQWKTRFSPKKFPVLALSSAPAAFPARPEHRVLQNPFIGIHLRNNFDWDNVCNLIKGPSHTPTLFASAQCTGYNNEFGSLTEEACKPSLNTILEEVGAKVVELKARSVFVASDHQHYLEQLRDRIKELGQDVNIVRIDPSEVHLAVELALLELSDHFVGNCVSTFSAFVVRQREFHYDEKPTSFFAFSISQNQQRVPDEL
uniref:GDP-fucose protein O-fucosyltransferase 1 n=1 Tax=Ditylenchus dipsaci TaxID=166011 RepID=A0A915CYU7_9BILA